MDLAYLHIITNHIPIIGVPFALFLLLLGIWRKSDDLKSAAFLIFVFLGFATLGTFLIGQGGEDFVEDLAGVSENAIENHEDFAKFALGSVAVTAIMSLFALIRYKGFSFLKRQNAEKTKSSEDAISARSALQFPNWISFAILLLALANSAILGYTGKLGGKIRHTEFYGNSQNTEEEGKNRRGKTEERPEKISPINENQTTQSEETEENEESGKKRKRNSGGRN